MTDSTPASAEAPDSAPDRHRSAYQQLRDSDPVLARLIAARGELHLVHDVERYAPQYGMFGALLHAIIGQMLSRAASRAIFQRLVDRFEGIVPTPAQILTVDPEELRTTVGTSHAKVVSMRDLAERVTDGRLDLDALPRLDDDQARAALLAVRGIGPWTADKILLTELDRDDVLNSEDLPLRHAIQALYSLNHTPSPREVDELGQRWQPHRSLASLYLRSSELEHVHGGNQ